MPRDHWEHNDLNPRGRRLYGNTETSPRLKRMGRDRRRMGGSSRPGWLIASAIIAAAAGFVYFRAGLASATLDGAHEPAKTRALLHPPKRPPEAVITLSPEPAVPFPPSGLEIRHTRYTFDPHNGPFSIDARTIETAHVVVRVYSWSTDKPVATVYLDRGTFHRSVLPPGGYRFRIAYGDNWNGDEKLFGPSTTVQRTERPSAIVRNGRSSSGFVLQLNPPTGNLPATQTGAWSF